ncbi:MAG TPA: helix-turn-helix transcriptional regulator [Streptosporangiaceae bacterium]
MTISPPSSIKQAQEALGTRLREMRLDAGLSARALAAATGQHFTRVSKLEHGTKAPSDQDIRDWCRACDAQDQAEDLIATARAVASAYLEFKRQSRAGMKRVAGPHTLQLYQKTALFRIYEHNVIPGLFQTADYAAAMLSFWIKFLDTPDDLNAAVEIRMERQRVLYQGRKQFSAILQEQALRTCFGDATTQAGQLDRLLAVMSLPNVSVGIIPMMLERTAVPSAGFWIFDDVLVALETPTASIEVTRPREIALYVKMYEHLQSAAVYGGQARGLIVRTLQELSSGNFSQPR